MRLLLPICFCLASLLVAGCFDGAPTPGVVADPDPSAVDTIHRSDSARAADTLQLAHDWAQAASAVAGGPIQAIAQGESLFVAVGARGSIVTSANGITWKSVTSGTSEKLLNVTRGKTGGVEMFVAVGENGTLLTSLDGVTWIPVEIAHQSVGTYFTQVVYPDWVGIAWNGSVYVAVGSGGIVTPPDIPGEVNMRLISSDGVHWTSQWVSGGLVQTYVDLVWDPALADGQGRFVATYGSGSKSYSLDGLQWSNTPTP